MSAGADVSGRELVSVDPATLAVVGHVDVTTPEELSEILAEARLAHESFARQPLDTRCRLLERVSHVIVEEADAIARTIVSESGKPLAEAYAHDLVVAAEACRWHAANLEGVLGEERLAFPQLVFRQKRGWLRYEPLGVVGIVTPWNFPLAIALRQAAAAVAAGNAAVVKPSELTPLTGAWVEELFRLAGAPAGLVRVVQGAGDLGDALVRHRGIHGIVFTGSVEVGRHVARAAAERLCPVVLELGGKDAMLVLDDADLDRAVEGALWAPSQTAARRAQGSSASPWRRGYTTRSSTCSPRAPVASGSGTGSMPTSTSARSSARGSAPASRPSSWTRPSTGRSSSRAAAGPRIRRRAGSTSRR